MLDHQTLQRINQKMDTVTFVEHNHSLFQLVGEPTSWLHAFCPNINTGDKIALGDVFVFLADFINEAREQLGTTSSEHKRDLVSSGPWSERDLHDDETSLSATALLLDDQLVIQIRSIATDQRYHEAIFQKAREYSLSYEQLQKEQDKKQVLLHTIVHDIASPMMVIEGSLGLLADGELSDAQKRNLANAEDQANLVNMLVKNVLDVFSMDIQPFDPDELTRESAPRLLNVLNKVLDNYSGVFHDQGIRIRRENRLDGNVQVIAEQWGLTRVFINLLENAVRYSPNDAEVTVTTFADEEFVRVEIADEGPGVSPELLPGLFERFTGGRSYGGKAGLGLYFCKTSLRQWSGNIEYAPGNPTSDSPSKTSGQADSGSRFIVSLHRFTP